MRVGDGVERDGLRDSGLRGVHVKYIVQIQDGPVKKWAKGPGHNLGWTYHRQLAHEFFTVAGADEAIRKLHGGAVVEVDA